MQQNTTIYNINDVYPCLQGEGVLAGVPMVLVRTQGCAVGCSFCDTKETWDKEYSYLKSTLADALGTSPKWAKISATDLAAYVERQYPQYKWILLTGGEPSEQDLVALVDAFHKHGKKVALETSGTATGHLEAKIDWVCVSPKINQTGGKTVLPITLEHANEIKHVVGIPKHIDELDTLLKGVLLREDVTICLQPMSQSKKATELCIKTVQERGWRLSLQTHKYLDLR